MTTTIILSSGRCSWGKCYACGWGKLESPVDVEKMKKQASSMHFDKSVKAFSSGTFLDDRQFPRDFRKWFASHLRAKGVENLTLEALPSYVTDENLSDFKELNLTVAIGLESAHDTILEKYQKPFRTKDFVKAVGILRNNGCKVRTYLMVNMPFSEDMENELKESVDFALKHSDSIVLINTFPHSNAQLFDDWIEGKWKPLSVPEFERVVKKYKGSPKIETDAQNYAFRPKFPPEKRKPIEGVSLENLTHPYYEVWQDYFQRFYEPQTGRDILLFLPCSFKKPYAASSTHKAIYKALSSVPPANRIHRVVVSNPGVIPIEFSDHYPFNAYDWPEWDETPEIMDAYVRVNKERVRKYLEAHKDSYTHVFAFMKYSETYDAIKQGCDGLGIPVRNLLDIPIWDRLKGEKKNPVIHPLALSCLRKNLMRIK